MESNVYDHGQPFSEILIKALDSFKQRVFEQNKAVIIIVDGGLGEGKTTLAVELADYLKGSPIDFDINMSMGGNEFSDKLEQCYDKQERVLIYDEAGDFNRRGTLSKFNRELNRIFDTYRTFRIILILVVPHFKNIDNNIFDSHIVRLLLHCQSRNKRSGTFKGYSLDKLLYMKRMLKKSGQESAYIYNVCYPNIIGHFLNLPKERCEELNQHSTKHKKEILTKANLRNQGLICIKEISETIHRNPLWVHSKIKQLHIKPVRQIKRSFYYKDTIIEELLSLKVRA